MSPTQAPVPLPTSQQPNGAQAGILPSPKVSFTQPNMPSMPAVDFGQFTDNPQGAASAFQAAQSQLSNSQQAARAAAFDQYNQAVQGFGSTADQYNQLSNAFGVPAYQRSMNDLQYAISHLRDNVRTRTQGFNVNEAQADKLYNSELNPMAQNLADVGREYNTATTNIANLMKYYGEDRNLQLRPIETYLNTLDSSFANQNQVFGNLGTLGLKSVQDAVTNRLEQSRLDQAANQFAQTFGLEQLKNQQSVEQFAKMYNLDVEKFRQATNEFAANNALATKEFEHNQFWAGKNNELELVRLEMAKQAAARAAAASAPLDLSKYMTSSSGGGQTQSANTSGLANLWGSSGTKLSVGQATPTANLLQPSPSKQLQGNTLSLQGSGSLLQGDIYRLQGSR